MFECKKIVLKFACWHFRIEILQANVFKYNSFQLQNCKTPFQDHIHSKKKFMKNCFCIKNGFALSKMAKFLQREKSAYLDPVY